MLALRTGRCFVNAWIYLGKRDEALVDAAMASFLVSEQRGFSAAQSVRRTSRC